MVISNTTNIDKTISSNVGVSLTQTQDINGIKGAIAGLPKQKTEQKPKVNLIRLQQTPLLQSKTNYNCSVLQNSLGGLRTGDTKNTICIPKKITTQMTENERYHAKTIENLKIALFPKSKPNEIQAGQIAIAPLSGKALILVSAFLSGVDANKAYACYLNNDSEGMKKYALSASMNITFTIAGFALLKAAKIKPKTSLVSTSNMVLSIEKQEQIGMLRSTIMKDVYSSNFTNIEQKLLKNGMNKDDIACFISKIKDENVATIIAGKGQLGERWNEYKVKTLLTAYEISKRFSIPYNNFLHKAGTSQSAEKMIEIAKNLKK